MKILAVVQARMSSQRLPGKVLEPILGRPMLERQLERVRRARRLDELIVATSQSDTDDAVAAFCEQNGIFCYRGNLHDVLSRYVGAVNAYGSADHIVRLTADCPLADPEVIDDCVDLQLSSGADYTSNAIDRTYPDGLDVEVLTASTLARLDRETKTTAAREHVTTLVRSNPDLYRIANLTQSPNLSHLRWTVDAPDDLAFVRSVYVALYPKVPNFTTSDVLALPFGRREPNSLT